MRIFYYNTSINSATGSSIHTRELIHALKKDGNEVIVYPSESSKVTLKIPRFVRKVPILLKQILMLINGIREKRKHGSEILRRISEFKPDMILIRFSQYDFVAKLITQNHSNIVALEVNAPLSKEIKDHYVRWYGNQVQYRLETYLYNSARIIYTVSDVLKEIISNSIADPQKIFTVANGSNTEIFHSNQDHRDQLRAQYGLSDQFVLGFVGYLRSWHGLDILLDCMRSLIHKHNDFRLVIIGGYNQREEIEMKLKSLSIQDYVLQLPHIEHIKMPEYIDIMDITIAPYPKLKEFYFSPLKIFEYMSMGKPVVASKIGQISKIIQNNENGLLFEPGNLAMMEEKIEQLYRDPNLRAKIGSNARDTIVKNYTWDHTAKKITAFFSEFQR